MTADPDTHTLVPALRDVATATDRLPEAADPVTRALARRVRTRILRDLLPRLGSEAPLLLVAVAGPNNVGKSTLFNTLVGAQLSPARAEGGLTQQCLAAATPETASGPGREALSARYDVVLLPPGARAPVTEPGPPGRLFLTSTATLPAGLVLVDTPDFDSVVRENRLRSEALLVTVDVVVFVVSRHTYQNAALVDVVQQAVGRGRPWVVVYNEAPELETVRAHLDKLAADVGAPPFARYRSPHDPEVEAGRRGLAIDSVDGGPALAELLGDPQRGAALRSRARSAALRDAAAELRGLATQVGGLASEPERLRTRIRHGLAEVGARAALRAVPADVLVEAFRDELDARSPVHRWIRRPFRGLAAVLGAVGRKLRASFSPPQPEALDATAAAATDAALRDGVRQLVEALGPELAAWRGDTGTREALAQALGLPTLSALQAPGPLVEDASLREDRAQLLVRCRELVRAQLPGGFEEGAIQAMATLVYSVPASAAAAVTVATGGIGHDAVVWVGTLLTTPLLERFVDLLGTGVRGEVVRTWSEKHGASLGRALQARLFGPLLQRLDAQVASAEGAAATFSTAAEQLEGGEA
ncbi:MAG TPA: GTPase [Myxococcaceae bacterium]|nr:GTPase [Myxococcaceae bacterium]